ncbi:unnamed protein product [Aphanomyces euteiches]
MGPKCRSFTITKDLLTTGPMEFLYSNYKSYFSSNIVTFEWRVTRSGADLILTNASRHEVYVDHITVAPGAAKALIVQNAVRLLISPAKFLLLGYVVSLTPFPPPSQPPSRNVLGVLFAHPIMDYATLGLSFNNRGVHMMHSSMSTRLVKYMRMSELRLDDKGSFLMYYPEPIDLAVEFATWEVLKELVEDGCRIIHLACAATDEYIVLEDGRGGPRQVRVDELRTLFAGSAVKVVQISVYNGCDMAHKLFLDAGVPYVVALAPRMSITSSHLLRFSTNFYRGLIGGKSVEASFRFAQQSSMAHDIFCLYCQPSDTNRGSNIILFPLTDKPRESHALLRSSLRKDDLSIAVCKEFTGRLQETFNICYRLMDPRHETRFINIHGPASIGKTQLALAATQYVSFRGIFDGGIRVLHVKDVVERKGHDHSIVWMQRIVFDITHASGLMKSFLVVLDGLDVFMHSSYEEQIVDFVERVLVTKPNISIITTTLLPISLLPKPDFKQFHVGLDKNPVSGLMPINSIFHDLSTDSYFDDSTRVPDESYDIHASLSPTGATTAPRNCTVM